MMVLTHAISEDFEQVCEDFTTTCFGI